MKRLVLFALALLALSVPAAAQEWPDAPVLPETADHITRAEVSVNNVGFIAYGPDARLEPWLGLRCQLTDFSGPGETWPFWGWWNNPEHEPRGVYARVYIHEQTDAGNVDWWLWCNASEACVQRTRRWYDAMTYTHPVYGVVQNVAAGYHFHHWGAVCELPE